MTEQDPKVPNELLRKAYQMSGFGKTGQRRRHPKRSFIFPIPRQGEVACIALAPGLGS